MINEDRGDEFQSYVSEAVARKQPFNICGNNSKTFLGQARDIESLSIVQHSGVVAYEPTELVVTARAGTPVKELEQLLNDSGQMMPFEPPVFDDNDTLGGVMACGLSGPRRAYAGAARDYVLGMQLINGKAERLHFGGEVMKNVAGYDVSRLQVGAMGTLGLILDVSMKVLPKPEVEQTVVLNDPQPSALGFLTKLARKPVPVSATAVIGDQCYIRLSGHINSVRSAAVKIGGEELPDSAAFWSSLRCHKHPFFTGGEHLWRISVADHAPALPLAGEWLHEWGGAQRWLTTELPANEIYDCCARVGAHATRFRGFEPGSASFQPLEGALLTLHQRVKAAFDPDGLFNPGRYHAEI